MSSLCQSEFPMRPIDSLKFSLMNCAFFYRPPLSLRETTELLEHDGDFLVQDSNETKLLLSVRVYGVVSEFHITIVQNHSRHVLFEFAGQCFPSLEHLVLTFSNGRGGKHFLKTVDGDEFLLVRPILRALHAGRFGYGERMEVSDSTETDLERLIELDHRNLVRVCDFFKQSNGCCGDDSPSDGVPPVVVVRFELVPSAQSLFDKLFHLQSVLSAKQYISWAYQAGNGLSYLMDRGFFHRRLHARACVIDSAGKTLRITDFWTENDPGDIHLFQSDAYLPNTVLPSAVMYRDGWRYLPTETLIESKFDSASQVWSFALLVWQIYTHCQFGNRIFYSSLAEFLSLSAAIDDPFFMPGHLTRRQAQLGMPEQRRQKMLFLKAFAFLPSAPETLAEIVPRALSSNPADRPCFCELLRVIEVRLQISNEKVGTLCESRSVTPSRIGIAQAVRDRATVWYDFEKERRHVKMLRKLEGKLMRDKTLSGGEEAVARHVDDPLKAGPPNDGFCSAFGCSTRVMGQKMCSVTENILENDVFAEFASSPPVSSLEKGNATLRDYAMHPNRRFVGILASKKFMPNLKRLAEKILCILASSAHAERAFSHLRRLKTDFRRCNMAEETISAIICCGSLNHFKAFDDTDHMLL
ncbi:hypothetical protein niasHT_019439 [Heterodera trifolii]|uniref:Protein kinase domain-containing protein n=1 Tax=Heterodera trifolii TaxID=157864 RepID=A0ABD2KVV8_9BILA